MTGNYQPGMKRSEKLMLRAALVIAFLALLTVAFAVVGTECSLSSIRADSSCSVGDDDTILNDLVIRSGTAFDLTQSHSITANRNPTWPDAAGVVVLDSNIQAVSAKTITASSIDSSPVGASSANTGAFTTLDTTGALTVGGDTTLQNNDLNAIGNANTNITSSGATFATDVTVDLDLEVGALDPRALTTHHADNTQGVSSGSDIITIDPANNGSMIMVIGDNGSNVRFIDLLLAGRSNFVVVQALTVNGAPAARVYTMTLGVLNLALASGTYDINAYSITPAVPL